MCTYLLLCVHLLRHSCMRVFNCIRLGAGTFLTASLVCFSLCFCLRVWARPSLADVSYLSVVVDVFTSASRVCASCRCFPRSPGSTLSAQSVPVMYTGQLPPLAPGGLAGSGSSTVLQPLKQSPSSDNLCSAYTSEAALSVPSLCAPTPGKHVTESCRLQLTSVHHLHQQIFACRQKEVLQNKEII